MYAPTLKIHIEIIDQNQWINEDSSAQETWRISEGWTKGWKIEHDLFGSPSLDKHSKSSPVLATTPTRHLCPCSIQPSWSNSELCDRAIQVALVYSYDQITFKFVIWTVSCSHFILLGPHQPLAIHFWRTLSRVGIDIRDSTLNRATSSSTPYPAERML